MKSDSKALLKETFLIFGVGIVVSAVAVSLMDRCGLMDGVSWLELSSTFLGIIYVVMLRNPNNYFSFIVGILSSVALGLHSFNEGLVFSSCLYFLFFIPCQSFSLYLWMAGGRRGEVTFMPSSLGKSEFYVVCAMIVGASVAIGWFSNSDLVCKVSESLFVTTNIASNVLIIKKKIECWYLWVVSNFFAAVLFCHTEIYFTVFLNFVYLIVNMNALMTWTKMTAKEDVNL